MITYLVIINLFSIDPLKLIVTLNGEAKDAVGPNAGVYVLGPNPICGKSHWLKDPSSNRAIWYNKEIGIWAMGLKSYLGSTTCSLLSYDDVDGPQKVKNWKYANPNGPGFMPSDDILVDTFDEPGTGQFK